MLGDDQKWTQLKIYFTKKNNTKFVFKFWKYKNHLSINSLKTMMDKNCFYCHHHFWGIRGFLASYTPLDLFSPLMSNPDFLATSSWAISNVISGNFCLEASLSFGFTKTKYWVVPKISLCKKKQSKYYWWNILVQQLNNKNSCFNLNFK